MIIVFSGSSGVGKNAVICGLLAKNPDWKLFKSISTRLPRTTESQTSTVSYITKPMFEQKIANNEMLEFELIHSQFYGIEKKPFYEALESNDIYLKDVGVLGHENLVKFVNGSKKFISIFLTANKSELQKRLVLRNDTFNIEERLSRYDFELSYSKNYDLILKNDLLPDTINKAECFIKSKKEN